MAKRNHVAVLWCAAVVLCSVASGETAEVERRPAPPTLPAPPFPAQYVIEQVDVRAAPQAGALQGTMAVRLRCLTGEETWLPLFSGNVGVISAKAAGGGFFGTAPLPMRRRDTVGVLLADKGEYSLEIEFATPIARDRQTNSALIPMVPALSAVYEVTLAGQNLEVRLEPDIPYQEEVAGALTTVTVYGTVEGELRLCWKPGPEVREVETIAFAEQNMLLDISPGLLRVETEIDYTLLQGQMSEALVALPVGYSLLKVESDNMRSWDLRTDDAGRSTLAVALLEPAGTRFRLTLTLEKTLDPVPVEIEAPQVEALNVARERGAVAVAVEKGLQAEIVQKSNIGQVNLSEMPIALQSLGDRFSLGLRYLARPFTVKLRVSTIEPKVYGEVSCLTVASLERFRQQWDVQYEIRNAGLFQLKLRLAPDMKLVSLRGDNINNQSLDPATNVLTVDLRSKAEGTYSLSLQTSSEIADPERAVLPTLELVGAERQWGTIAVSADAGIAVETESLTGISQIDVAELRSIRPVQQMVTAQKAPEPMLAFRYLSFPHRLELVVSHVEPELKAEPQHLIQITRKNLRYNSVFDYRIKKAGVFQLRLHLPPELRGSLLVKGDKVEDYSYDAASSTLTVQLTEKALDELRIELETEVLLGKELPKPGESDTFAIPAIYTLDCEQERGHIALATDESIRLKRSGEGGSLHDVDVQEIPPELLQRAPNAKLAFRLVESPWELAIEVTSISPKITAQTFNYVRFGEDYLMGASTVEFTIQYAGVEEFLVRLPEGVSEPNIRGENIKIQEKVKEEEPKPGELWRIELQSEAKGSYQLIFEYTMDLDAKESMRRFTGPSVIGEMKEVEREIGYLAVTGDPSLELTPIGKDIEGLTPVDEEEIPLKFRQLPPSVASQVGRETVPILFAFRYLAQPYALVLSSVRHDEADVVTAVVESCKLDTTLTREGNRITSLVASVRSRYQPFFEIRLPEGAKLWHALVNGRRVRPLTETTPEGEVTKIPIAQVQGVTGPVAVELQWEELGGGELGKAEAIRLRMPSLVGVRVLRLGWILQLPRGYHMLSSSGTLERLPSESDFEESLRSLQPARQPGDSAQTARQQAAQSQQQLSNELVLLGRAAGKQSSRVGPAVVGAKPQLPQRFYFQGLILNPEVPAEARAICMTSSVLTPGMVLLVLVVFALCGLFWFKSGLPGGVSFIVLTAAALVVAGLRVVAEGDYADPLAAVVVAIAAAAVAFGFTSLYDRLHGRTRRAEAPAE